MSRPDDEDDQSCLLCLIFDVISMQKQHQNLHAGKVLGEIILFCNSYLLMHRQNRLVFIVVTNTEAKVIYPPKSHSNNKLYPVYHEVASILCSEFAKLQQFSYCETSETPTTSYSLSNSFSKSLCIINDQQKKGKFYPRMLVIQFSKDRIIDYNSIMNSIFSAQKMGVIIDSFIVSKFDSHILQQASFLTGGLYIKHMDENDVLQFLTTYFLSDNKVRELYNQPLQKSIDFKASCYCHNNPVEYAYMCSVCLALLCSDDNLVKCPVCETPVRSRSQAVAKN